MKASNQRRIAGRTLRATPILRPGNLQLRRGEKNRMQLVFADGRQIDDVQVMPAFPITRPNRLIYLFGHDGRELGLIEDPRELDKESRDLILTQADHVYFMPRITRVIQVDEKMGVARWEVETDRGRTTFEVATRSESTWYMGRYRIVIRDVDGNRFMIEDLSQLDPKSQHLAELFL